ncbi:MAG: hypothetical protein AAFV25_24655, partial [Bacteroidota bacterium]
PDVSHLTVDLNVVRFEQALFSMDTTQMATELAQLKERFPYFTELYLVNVMGIRPQMISEEQYAQAVKGLISNQGMRQLYDTTQIVYGDLTEIESELSQAFQYFRYHFPDLPVPDIYTFVSEYSYAAFVADNNILALGLDFGLGEGYPYYDPRFFPRYIRRTMNKEHLPKLAIDALVDDLVGQPMGDRLLDQMIHNGKKLYILDALMPHVPDSIRLGYTAAQSQWCEDNEGQMWAYFLTEDLLYSTQVNDIRKLVDHSPNSPGMPPEAPGRTANWMGWKIVESYMKRHPDSSMKELIEMRDAQKLLEGARYKPPR